MLPARQYQHVAAQVGTHFFPINLDARGNMIQYRQRSRVAVVSDFNAVRGGFRGAHIAIEIEHPYMR